MKYDEIKSQLERILKQPIVDYRPASGLFIEGLADNVQIPDAIVCWLENGDQIIYNSDILDPSFEHSGYNSVWTDGTTEEWLQTVEDGIVTSCSRSGGSHGWQLYSISRWTAADGRKLKKHLEMEFENKKNTQIYWDDVSMFCYPDEYQLSIYEMQKGDIIEIDDLQELAEIDSSYKKYMED